MQQPVCRRKDQHLHKMSKWTSGSTWALFCTSKTNQWNTGKPMLEAWLLKAGVVDNRALDHALICRILPRLALLILTQNKETCNCQSQTSGLIFWYCSHLFFRYYFRRWVPGSVFRIQEDAILLSSMLRLGDRGEQAVEGWSYCNVPLTFVFKIIVELWVLWCCCTSEAEAFTVSAGLSVVLFQRNSNMPLSSVVTAELLSFLLPWV